MNKALQHSESIAKYKKHCRYQFTDMPSLTEAIDLFHAHIFDGLTLTMQQQQMYDMLVNSQAMELGFTGTKKSLEEVLNYLETLHFIILTTEFTKSGRMRTVSSDILHFFLSETLRIHFLSFAEDKKTLEKLLRWPSRYFDRFVTSTKTAEVTKDTVRDLPEATKTKLRQMQWADFVVYEKALSIRRVKA